MTTELDIIATKLDGQNARIQEAVEKERERLLNFIRRHLPEEEEAEDLLQDVFYQLIESYRLMKPIERLSSWLFTVARNKITDRFRKKKAIPFSHLSNTGDDQKKGELLDRIPAKNAGPEAEFTATLIMDELEEALGELPPAQREAFVLHEIEGHNFEQIAAMTGVKVKTLISRKRYAVLYLRERLEAIYREFLEE